MNPGVLTMIVGAIMIAAAATLTAFGGLAIKSGWDDFKASRRHQPTTATSAAPPGHEGSAVQLGDQQAEAKLDPVVTELQKQNARAEAQERAASEQREHERRARLVWMLANEWVGVRGDGIPTTDREIFDQATPYINERLAARGETWSLTEATRRSLDLP